MIYEDVYAFLMKQCSSKEVDIVLYLINHSDWNHTVTLDIRDIAKKTGTTTRYVKEVIRKFLSFFKGKRILAKNNTTEEGTYTLLIGKSSLFYSKGDNYGKKYAFLYTEAFQNLSIYAKRLLLHAVMSTSKSNDNVLYVPVNHFVFRNGLSSGLIPSKKVFMQALESIQHAFPHTIHVSLVSTILTKEEAVYLHIDQELLDHVLYNHTERSELRKVLFHRGFFRYVPDSYCIELEKVAKYIFNGLLSHIDKQTMYKGVTDDVLYMARHIYNQALGRLANSLTDFLTEDKEPGELSAYFSSIVFSIMAEEMTKYQNQADLWTDLAKKTPGVSFIHNPQRIQAQSLAFILKKWCEHWAFSRCQTEKEESKSLNQEKVDKNTELKTYIQTFFQYIEAQTKTIVCHHVPTILTDLRQQIVDFIDVTNERMLRLTN